MMAYQHQVPTFITNFDAFHAHKYSSFSVNDIKNNYKRARFGFSTTWKIDLFALNKEKYVWQTDLKAHTSCVNAVEFNKTEDIFATGGDDLRVLLWRVSNALSDEKPKPFTIMSQKHDSNIFALAWNHDSRKVMSAGNDDRFFVHDVETTQIIQSYRGSTYYCLSVHAENDNIVATATDNSRIYLYDIRSPPGQPVQCLRETGENFCVNFNQKVPYMMAICNKQKGLSVIDIRANRDDFCVRGGIATAGAIYASWNETGTGLFTIRSNKLPVYFDVNKRVPLICKDKRYRNNITIKSCDFVGNDYAITGSDKWDIFCWKIPNNYDDNVEDGNLYASHPDTDQAYTILQGHRSIVNHCRYSKSDDIILSCGVEKCVKMWSSAKLNQSYCKPIRRQLFPVRHLSDIEDDEEEMEFVNDNDIEEDSTTLRLFDEYINSEGSIRPYTVDVAQAISEVAPPVFFNEDPENNRQMRHSFAVREMLRNIVESDLFDDYSGSSENGEDENPIHFLDSDDAFEYENDDENNLRFIMDTSPEMSPANSGSDSSSDEIDTSSNNADSGDTTQEAVLPSLNNNDVDGFDRAMNDVQNDLSPKGQNESSKK